MTETWSLLTTAEAARQLDVSTEAILRYCKSGVLRSRRHGRFVLVEQRSVLALMKIIHAAKHGAPVPPTVRRARAAAAARVASAETVAVESA